MGSGVVATASVGITVLPAIGAATGRGRLIHPTFGTYDYPYSPDRWTNIDGDVIIPPIWSSSKTLLGSANTLFVGNLRDVTVEEEWNQELAGSTAHMRMLLAMWMNPPDPTLDYVEWYPNYTSALGFKVIMIEVTVGGQGVSLDYITRQGWVTGVITLKMKIAGRI